MVTAKVRQIKMKKISSAGMMPRTISHELSQPLNSIKMISGGILYLLKQGKRLPDEEVAECMNEIVCQADRIAAIIKNKNII